MSITIIYELWVSMIIAIMINDGPWNELKKQKLIVCINHY